MTSETVAGPERLGEPKAAGAPGGLVWAWYGLVVLMMTTLFAFVVRQMLSLIAPDLQASLGFTDLQLGMLQGLGMAIFACVASYPMGWLADRFGRRMLLAIGVACWSLATALCAFQDSFGGLFLGTIGIAIGEAGLAPIVYAMIPDLFPERKRNTANFIFYGGSLLGASLGMVLGGVLLEWLGGARLGLPAGLAGLDTWRIAMMAVALPGPLFILLVATMPLGRGAKTAPKTDVGAAPMAAFLPYARANWRTLTCIFGSIFAAAVAMTSCLVWYPLALPRAFGVDPASVGVSLGVAVGVATLIGVALPALALRFGPAVTAQERPLRVARLFFGMAAAPLAVLPFVASPFQAYAVAAAMGTMGIAGSALTPGLLQTLAPPELRSRVLALLGIVNALALAVSPLAIGALSGLLVGPRGVLQAIAIVGVPSLAAAAILMSLALRPYAATVRGITTQLPEQKS